MSRADESTTTPPDSFERRAALVDRAMAERFSAADLPVNLREAVEYALLAGGKRTRPVLLLESCEAVGGRAEDAMPAAMAIELIHAFSLVHDDLPAMDDDDLRRGRPTLHIRSGEAMAILAGDAMMSLAFQVICENVSDGVAAAKLVGELASGTTAMIAGQVYDTLGGFEKNLDDRARLALVHRNKTGALIRAACRMGAISGGADDSTLGALTNFGDAIGLMFQVVDDLLDIEQTAEHTGKRTNKDHEAGKLTYPGVWGVEASRREVARLHEEAISALAPLGDEAAPLRDICHFLAVRTR
ncbi:MAG: polyprenyl synthetase family protein [Phycisphaeraceae bacterium]|nr:MAG: polyprenyl synthetase family protein [Phycisphaeraceae bacterium]